MELEQQVKELVPGLYLFNSKSIEDEPNNIKYDDTSVDPIPIFNNNIWGTALEIDVGLFNIPHYLIGSSWLNILTGVSTGQVHCCIPLWCHQINGLR